MNAKLKRILPVDMFCCATLLCLSFQRCTVEVWNGGMPDGYLHDSLSGMRTPLPARHLPLGVLTPQLFDDRTEVHAMRSEEHTSELQSLMRISYAVFCLKKNKMIDLLLTIFTNIHIYKSTHTKTNHTNETHTQQH